MSSKYRHDEILRRLTRDARIRIDEVAAALSVSTETIRRDLGELEARSLVRRVHGGAVPFHLEREPPVGERARIRAKEKSQLGAAAAALVEDGMSIFIDAGSTSSACARHLIGRANLTVTTNSLDIAEQLSSSAGIRVRVAPGIVRKIDNAIGGQETCNYIQRFAFDIALVGIGACDETMGWMDFEEDEASLRRTVAPRTRRLVVLADSSKFGQRASVQTFPIDHTLIVATNKPLSASFAQIFRKAGVQIIKP